MAGLDEDGERRTMYSFTPWQNDWDDEPPIGGLTGTGQKRANACAFTLNNKGYITLGQGVSSFDFKNTWEFDEVTDVWTQKADFLGGRRAHAVSFVIDEIAYVGTGHHTEWDPVANNGNGGYVSILHKDMYKYDPLTNTWTQLNDFGGTARQDAVGFAMGGQGYIGTGDDGVVRNDFWQYEPTNDSWVQKANLPGAARRGATAWGVFPQGFICTGQDNFNYMDDLWEYNYYADAWVQRASFPGGPRTNACAFVLNGIAYMGTGYDGVSHDDYYAYQRVLGVEEESVANSLEIYPNPVVTHFTVKANNEQLEVKLYDFLGRDVSSEVRVIQNGSSYMIDRNDLPSGNYIIKMLDTETGFNYEGKVIFV
jgi:N-acetylneuraminic acid mutarotase